MTTSPSNFAETRRLSSAATIFFPVTAGGICAKAIPDEACSRRNSGASLRAYEGSLSSSPGSRAELRLSRNPPIAFATAAAGHASLNIEIVAKRNGSPGLSLDRAGKVKAAHPAMRRDAWKGVGKCGWRMVP